VPSAIDFASFFCGFDRQTFPSSIPVPCFVFATSVGFYLAVLVAPDVATWPRTVHSRWSGRLPSVNPRPD